MAPCTHDAFKKPSLIILETLHNKVFTLYKILGLLSLYFTNWLLKLFLGCFFGHTGNEFLPCSDLHAFEMYPCVTLRPFKIITVSKWHGFSLTCNIKHVYGFGCAIWTDCH